jgi:hypothetical protein
MEPPVHDLLRRLDHLSDQFHELREGVQKALRIADEDPEMALTRSRKVLELVVRDVYERHLGTPAGTQPLENLLQRLVKDGHLPRRLAAYANAVRELGNVGTHAFGERVTSADVHQSLTQLLPILEWYFESERPEALGPSPTPRPPAQTATAAPLEPKPAVVPRQGRWRAWLAMLGLAVLLGLAGLLAWHYRPAPAPLDTEKEGTAEKVQAGALKIDLRVTRLAADGPNLQRRGELGKETYRVSFNDRVELEATLSEPAYAYLIAFNPTGPTNQERALLAADLWSAGMQGHGRHALAGGPAPYLWELAEVVRTAPMDRPQDQEQFVPGNEADLPPEKCRRINPESRLRLDDGVGLQAFAVVASRQPLPAYAQWRKERPRLPWERMPATSGVVWQSDGGPVLGVYDPGMQRATEEKLNDKALIGMLARRLKRMPGVEAVSVMGFAVDPSN